MSNRPLARQPDLDSSRSELRSIFRQYLQAEESPEKISWQNMTKRDGLPHNWIYDLFQDSQNRIWAGTWGAGLAKFESGKWSTYTKQQGLHSNEVTCIREDSNGRIWIATDNGLNILENGTLRDGGLYGKSLLNMTFDKAGNLWVGCWRAALSGGGLFKWDGNQWDSFSTKQDLPGLEILKVFDDSQGRIWIGTYEHGIGAGVGCYDNGHWVTLRQTDGLINDCVYSMFEDPAGNMWFGTISGISIYDGKSWRHLTTKNGLADNRIYCMLIDSNKKMWFGTENGISRFDGQSWTSYTKKDGLVDNLVRAIIETRDGSLWFGTYPYAEGAGGISIARRQSVLSLTDRVLDLLPEPSQPKSLPPGEEA